MIPADLRAIQSNVSELYDLCIMASGLATLKVSDFLAGVASFSSALKSVTDMLQENIRVAQKDDELIISTYKQLLKDSLV